MFYRVYARPNGALVAASGTSETALAENAALLGMVDTGHAGPVDPQVLWWDGAEIVARPAPPAPPVLTAGVEAVWAGLPAGAVVTLDPMNGATPATVTASADGTVSLTLPAWTWRISVNEVFPAVAASWVVEVAP